MAVETGQAVLTMLYNRIRDDATMKSILGDPIDMYLQLGPDDPTFPYFWHTLNLNSIDMFHGNNTYFLDLWWYGEDASTPSAAIDRLKRLLHQWRFTTDDDEAVGIMYWFSGGFVGGTGNQRVWHYATQWDAHFGAARDTTDIITG